MSCCALEGPETEPSLLLATDFDGTIASIVPRPEDACIHPAARMILEQCAAFLGEVPAPRDPAAAVETLGAAIGEELDALAPLSPGELRAQRRAKYLAVA